MRIFRFWCWWRGYHREAGQAGFQYGINGYCDDCGKVGDGINRQDDNELKPVWGVYKMSRKDAWRAVRGLDHHD